MRFLHSSVTFIFLSFYWNLSAEAVSVYPDKNWARKSLSKSGKVVQAKLGTLLFGKDKPKSTDGVVIIHKGKLIYEGYKSPFGPKKKHIIWSVSKSYMSALIGMAVYENKLKLDHSICNFGYRTNCSITIRSLLHWASGLEWQETYENSRHPADSNVLSMLYGRNRFDMPSYVAGLSPAHSPLKKHLYSSGDTNLLSGILKKIYQKDYEAFVFEKLLATIGTQFATWEQDASGHFIASSYIYTTPRDMARLGYLFLQRGKMEVEAAFCTGMGRFFNQGS